MATNDFKPFANAPGSNVATAADYSANSGWATGYQAGVAQSKFLNFTWRQSSLMAAAIGQFIADKGINAVDDGVVANLDAAFTGALNAQINSPFRTVKRQIFTSSSTYTPSAGMIFCEVEAIGGGGGAGGAVGSSAPGAAAGGAGGGGGYVKRLYTSAQIGSGSVVQIGSGGTGGAAGANTGNGGGATGFVPGTATTLNLIAGSGGAGAGGPAATIITTGGFPGSGGAATGGDLNTPGDNAGPSFVFGGSSIAVGASGASSRYGAGGLIGSINANSNPGTGYGSGGSGAAAATVSRAGGNGAPGICIITEYCTQ